MTSASPAPAPRRNPLMLPLAIVSIIAVAEAVGLVIVLEILAARGTSPTPPVATGGAPGSPATPATGAPPVVAPGKKAPAAAQPARGKVGNRVESAGFGITVEKIEYEPTYKGVGGIGAEQRYFALLLHVENNTGGNASFFPAMFLVQDSQGFEYKPLPMHLKVPALDWRTMGNRETLRGYIDFQVPKSAKGLILIYQHLPRSDSQPIQVELGL